MSQLGAMAERMFIPATQSLRIAQLNDLQMSKPNIINIM